ncbi:MAG TPA: tyrosine-type recombinase/integrase [Syntrophorhabdaceae bacterium]|nr:tyrosine-type recombinase/integrase [Syntrophorhabdaceae bacterium]
MGLYKRGSTWWISFTYNGRQIRQSTETADKKLAEKIQHKVMTEVAEGKWFEKQQGTQTFAEMMQRYMKEHSAVKKRSTVRDQASLKHLLPFFGLLSLREIQPGHISRYKVNRLAAKAAPGTVNRELALMKHAFSLSIREWGWAKENPVKMVSMEKESPHKDRWLTDDEERRLLEVCPGWLKEVVTFAVDAGCRRGEILSLAWKSLDLQKGVAVVFGKKTSEWRGVPLTQRLRDMLTMKQASQKVRSLRDNSVFCNQTGLAVNIHELRWAFEVALRDAGIDNFRFHDLRHTFATRLAQNGVDLFTIQKLLGHKSYATTERYAHHHTESLRRGINVLDVYTKSLSNGGGGDKQPKDVSDRFITNLSQSAKNTLDFSGLRTREVFDMKENAREGT